MPQPLIDRYRDALPLEPDDPVVTLHEGSTPLVRAPTLSERLGVDVYLKLEGANPTGSFKDRGMTVAVSRALGGGAEAIICASTGNTAASAAAYAARAGLRGAVIVPEGKIAIGKLAQALMHGARVVALRGNFDDALRLVRELAQRHPIEKLEIVPGEQVESAFYLHLEVSDRPGVLAQVAAVFGEHEVSIRSVLQRGKGAKAQLVLVTHLAREGDVQATLAGLRGLPVVSSLASVMRVEGEEHEEAGA